MATPWSKTYRTENHTFRKYRDGDHRWPDLESQIFEADHTHKCPTYVHRTPPCQASCPSGEDVRGWLQVVRGLEKPPEGMSWQEYAFRRATDANPFPSQMGRVCPAPCEDGCNRNEVEDFVGINAVEQFIGDNAVAESFTFAPPERETGKRIAIVGGGPAGLAAAYQLRRRGHQCTIYDDHEALGGMMRYGIPGYRTPRRFLDHEIDRILALGGIETRLSVRVGHDVSIEQVEAEHDAVLWTIGCQSGRPLPVPGGGAPNCVSGVKFLEAFNEGRLQVAADRVVCVGGGDTSIDVVSVARRLGRINRINPKDRPEMVVHGFVAHDVAVAAARTGATVTLTSLLPRSGMTAAEHEVEDALKEGVTVLTGVMPIEVVLTGDGRARALRLAECDLVDGRPVARAGTEFEIEADLVVSAIGQGGNLEGLEELDNGRGLIDADAFYRVSGRPGHFVAGDIIRPHLLTTAIGQASIAASCIDQHLDGLDPARRPEGRRASFQSPRQAARAAPRPRGLRPSPGVGHLRLELRGAQLRGPFRPRDRAGRRAVPRTFPAHPPQSARGAGAVGRGGARALRGAHRRARRGAGDGRGGALHELRAVFRVRQLRHLLPAGRGVPRQEGQGHDRALRRHRLQSLHRLPHLRGRLPERLHRHGHGRVALPAGMRVRWVGGK